MANTEGRALKAFFRHCYPFTDQEMKAAERALQRTYPGVTICLFKEWSSTEGEFVYRLYFEGGRQTYYHKICAGFMALIHFYREQEKGRGVSFSAEPEYVLDCIRPDWAA